ncbi:MbtH family protein [Paractinoplanes hotanensis]|uniref:MbtH family NRPS accessory protein n=1 Tax=Paractinoplanes hotanensis TaxID=2906497 RepID=A0ABT0YAN4_9ACTN|nr:MbtH family NRPS accessory protein [Actinoplanes hotanensis]MCM4083097.1 MbtH family NRPS accessory protein [Actinoplanes hotanensis]
MSDAEIDDDTQYTVVRNDEEQYSLWWTGRSVPAGWHEVGYVGTREQCLQYIEQVWTDMRPRSLREYVAQPANQA